MEMQYDFLGRDKSDLDAKLPPVRCSMDFKRDAEIVCRSLGFKYAVLIRLIIGKLIASHKTYPKEMRRDSMHEIETNVEQVVEYIPVIRQQLKYNPKMYNST